MKGSPALPTFPPHAPLHIQVFAASSWRCHGNHPHPARGWSSSGGGGGCSWPTMLCARPKMAAPTPGPSRPPPAFPFNFPAPAEEQPSKKQKKPPCRACTDFKSWMREQKKQAALVRGKARGGDYAHACLGREKGQGSLWENLGIVTLIYVYFNMADVILIFQVCMMLRQEGAAYSQAFCGTGC